jgi:hypothetical protein
MKIGAYNSCFLKLQRQHFLITLLKDLFSNVHVFYITLHPKIKERQCPK